MHTGPVMPTALEKPVKIKDATKNHLNGVIIFDPINGHHFQIFPLVVIDAAFQLKRWLGFSPAFKKPLQHCFKHEHKHNIAESAYTNHYSWKVEPKALKKK